MNAVVIEMLEQLKERLSAKEEKKKKEIYEFVSDEIRHKTRVVELKEETKYLNELSLEANHISPQSSYLWFNVIKARVKEIQYLEYLNNG